MKRNMMQKILIVVLIIVTLMACGRHKVKPNLTAEKRMNRAMKMFKDGDYLDAKTEFHIIILNFPGGSLSDKAQFYYAECHFNLKEYILAIAEYEKLIRIYPNREYVDDAQYKIGLSNFKLSPKYSLDQTYTEKAVEEFQKFLEDYPESPLIPKANEVMRKCREKLAKKDFKNGESYRKRALYRSALVYYDHALENYYDTQYAEKSLWAKAECYRRMGDEKQAEKFYKLYLEKYPQSSKTKKIEDFLTSIKSNDSKE